MREALLQEYRRRLCSPAEAVATVQSGDRVFLGNCSSVAYRLFEALLERRDIEDVTLCCSNILRPMGISQGARAGRFRYESYFIGPDERRELQNGLTNFNSVHLSQSDIWVREIARPDVAFLEVSPPDAAGFMSLGASGICTGVHVLAAAKRVVLQVNRNVPYVLGRDNLVHLSQAEKIVEADDVLETTQDLPPSPALEAISQLVLELVPDGATFQLGLGGVAMAIGYALKQRNDLGIHSELMSDAMMELMRLGVVTNRRKAYMPGKTVAGFAFGSQALYRYLDHNPDFCFMPFTTVNDPRIIGQMDNFISVNTAMAVDLTGQVAADRLGFRQQSATGGQLDFVRGAQFSKGGKSIIALASTRQDKTLGQCSRIVSTFPLGSVVTTTRADVQYVATEYGCVNLKALNMQDRVRAMISLAHPDFRDRLHDEAKAAGLL